MINDRNFYYYKLIEDDSLTTQKKSFEADLIVDFENKYIYKNRVAAEMALISFEEKKELDKYKSRSLSGLLARIFGSWSIKIQIIKNEK